jgi:hypothetical protein
MLVSAEIRLPPNRRPAPEVVVKWYATSLRTHGVVAEPLPDDQLEFTVPIDADAETSWGHSLKVVSGGKMGVSRTERGLRVQADVRPRIWVWGMPALVIALAWGGFGSFDRPFSGLLAFGGIPFLLTGAAYCWWKVWGVLRDINDAIERSCKKVAPSHPQPGN